MVSARQMLFLVLLWVSIIRYDALYMQQLIHSINHAVKHSRESLVRKKDQFIVGWKLYFNHFQRVTVLDFCDI